MDDAEDQVEKCLVGTGGDYEFKDLDLDELAKLAEAERELADGERQGRSKSAVIV